jgi:hypothetical protein
VTAHQNQDFSHLYAPLTHFLTLGISILYSVHFYTNNHLSESKHLPLADTQLLFPQMAVHTPSPQAISAALSPFA